MPALDRLLYRASQTLGVVTLLGFLGGVPVLAYPADLCSHFRAHYAALALVLLGVSAARRLRAASLAAAGTLAINVALCAPLYAAPPPDALPRGASLRLLSWNVFLDNDEGAPAMLRYVQAREVDVALFVETSPEFLAAAQRAPSRYRLVLGHTLHKHYGLGLFARVDGRIALSGVRTMTLGSDHRHPAIEAKLRVGSAELALLGVHVHPPISPKHDRIRVEQFRSMARWSRAQRGPHVIVGDCNATLWSAPYRDFVRATLLHDAQAGRGLQATYSPFALPLVGIAIDHLFYGDGVAVRDFALGPYLGSDHRALSATLAVRQ